jgi:hypothetical protein
MRNNIADNGADDLPTAPVLTCKSLFPKREQGNLTAFQPPPFFATFYIQVVSMFWIHLLKFLIDDGRTLFVNSLGIICPSTLPPIPKAASLQQQVIE